MHDDPWKQMSVGVVVIIINAHLLDIFSEL